MAFHCTDFHETHNCSTTFLPDLYRISRKQANEETNYRKTFNSVFEYSTTVALTAEERRIRNCSTRLHANPTHRLLTDVWSQTDEKTGVFFTYGVVFLFHFVKNA
jgi:hypothetical protein